MGLSCGQLLDYANFLVSGNISSAKNAIYNLEEEYPQ